RQRRCHGGDAGLPHVLRLSLRPGRGSLGASLGPGDSQGRRPPRRYGQAREGVLRQDEPGQEVARMRDIHVSAISDAVKKLCMEANWELESDMLRELDRALTTDRSPAGMQVLTYMKTNAQW